MSGLIKKFNVTINNGDTETYEVGADAKNVKFSNEATSPFNLKTVEDNDTNSVDVPKEIVSKAENRIYGNAYIKHNYIDIEGRPEDVPADFGPISDIDNYRNNDGAGAMSISYGFNSLARHHHSSAIGFDCEAKGWASHAEGWKTITGNNSNCSHAEGAKTNALHNMAHAEGDGATAAGYGSHAEGRGTFAYGVGSHVEGMASNVGLSSQIAWQNSNSIHKWDYDIDNNASNNDVDVELTNPKTVINGQLSHAEGLNNTIYGSCCHAEGMYNTINAVYASTAMGEENQISASAAVAMGYKNTLNSGANNSLILGHHNTNPGFSDSIFLGRYCDIDPTSAKAPALVIGDGTNENNLHNLFNIRHAQTGSSTTTNRGELWGRNLDAYFGKIYGPLDVDRVTVDIYGGTNGSNTYGIGYTCSVVGGVSAETNGNVSSLKTTFDFQWIKPAGVLNVKFKPFNNTGNSFAKNVSVTGKKLFFDEYITNLNINGDLKALIKQKNPQLISFINNDLYDTVEDGFCSFVGKLTDENVTINYSRMDIKKLVNNIRDKDTLMIGDSNNIGSNYHPEFSFTFYGKPQ